MMTSPGVLSNGYHLHNSNHKIIENNNFYEDYSGGGGGGGSNTNQLHPNQYFLQHHSKHFSSNSNGGVDFQMQSQYSSNGNGNCSSVIISK